MSEKRASGTLPFLFGLLVGGAGMFMLGQFPELRTGWFWQTQTEAAPTASACKPDLTPLKLSGSGKGNTAPFCLAGGAYDVKLVTEKACTAYFSLKITPGSEDVGALAVSASAGTQINHIYNVPGRYRYYVGADSPPDCPWALTLTPQ
ncbi:hypothetical protein QR90_12730 [Deinococcus radiopugnans]|uniref:Uncharacterized protein n=1 Tax=Deinococcus radiopugnans TaxID=57497 RepID=A0A0A7KHY4_9DEIO|nr:hypothetical protein [Deinococcus radiopugnans]AIZ45751.1 hypothetical protein QR90_12730 [Deinococcus radiopugnans]